MSFNYDDYLDGLFKEPIFYIVATLVIFVSFIIFDLKFDFMKLKNAKYLLKFALFVVFAILFFTISTVRLNYGLPLKKDDYNNQIVLEGYVDSYRETYFSPRYYYDHKLVKGCIIVINDQRFYIMTIGDIKVGDYVNIEYLEKSKIVMNINVI